MTSQWRAQLCGQISQNRSQFLKEKRFNQFVDGVLLELVDFDFHSKFNKMRRDGLI